MLTDEQYKDAMARINVLMDKGDLTKAEGFELHRLACDAEEYEKAYWPIPAPTPKAAAEFRSDQERPLAADENTIDDYECPVCGSCGEVGCGCTTKCKPEDPRCMYRDYIARQLERELAAMLGPPDVPGVPTSNVSAEAGLEILREQARKVARAIAALPDPDRPELARLRTEDFGGVMGDKPDELFVICSPTKWGNPGRFDDDKYGVCAKCGVPIHWRPHNPEPSVKVCIECGVRALEDDEDPNSKLVVTEKTAREVEDYVKGRKR